MFACIKVFVYTTLVLLIILPTNPIVHPLSPDNATESKRKRNSVKMQPRKVKIKKAHGPHPTLSGPDGVMRGLFLVGNLSSCPVDLTTTTN